MLEEQGMSKHPAGRGGRKPAEQSPGEKGCCQRGGCIFPGGHVVSWQSSAWQGRCCWRKAGDMLAEAAGEGSLPCIEGPRWSFTWLWCSWAHMAAGPQTCSPNPPPQKSQAQKSSELQFSFPQHPRGGRAAWSSEPGRAERAGSRFLAASPAQTPVSSILCQFE